MPRRRSNPPRKVQAPAPPRSFNPKRAAINTFLIFHLVAIACWCLPVAPALTAPVKEFVRPYMLWSGLFQAWDMFAPSPKTANGYVEAIVLYTDGNTRNWAFPRMEQLSLTNRYFKERYRKYAEILAADTSAQFWPDAAKKIARLNNNRPAPVRMVFLVRYWSEIVPQSSGEGRAPASASPWDSHVFYSYTVQPGDLD